MNQGNEKGHQQDNGVWQDGGLFLHFADENRWLAFFLAFQSQSFHTDDSTGAAIPGQEAVVVPKPSLPPPARRRGSISRGRTSSSRTRAARSPCSTRRG